MDRPTLYSRGRYRVIGVDDDTRIRPYVVVDPAGSWLHEDASLHAAREWVDRREANVLARPSTSRRPGRSR
jgi:hypothetical protein